MRVLRMPAAGVVVVLLIALSFDVRPSDARSSGRSRRPTAEHRRHRDQLQLFEVTLLRDAQWRPVLRQKVVLDDEHRPGYGDLQGGATGDRLRLLQDDAQTAVAPLPVIRRVLRRFRWLGSHVRFAGYVLRAAFTCYTYANVSLLVELILRVHADEPSSSSSVFRDAWSALVRFLDKMAAVDADLDAIAELAYALAGAASGRAERMDDVVTLRSAIDATVDAHCVAPDRHRVYADLGLDGAAVRNADARTAFDLVVERLHRVYDAFHVQTMPTGSWTQIFNFEIPLVRDVNVLLTRHDHVAVDVHATQTKTLRKLVADALRNDEIHEN